MLTERKKPKLMKEPEFGLKVSDLKRNIRLNKDKGKGIIRVWGRIHLSITNYPL